MNTKRNYTFTANWQLFLFTYQDRKKIYSEGESPIDYLKQAIYCYATAIKFKPKDSNLHLQLAHVLEERYIVEDLLGLKEEVMFGVYPLFYSIKKIIHW